MKPEAPSVESSIRILKTATCPSMSEKSKLTYQVACSGSSEILFRISDNSGTGFFSQEWVPLAAIRQAFAKAPSEKSITSFVLYPLFSGKSINTPAFLLAVLKNEGVLVPSTTTRRSQEITDCAKFQAEMRGLMERKLPKAMKGGESDVTEGGAPKAKAGTRPKPATTPKGKGGTKKR